MRTVLLLLVMAVACSARSAHVSDAPPAPTASADAAADGPAVVLYSTDGVAQRVAVQVARSEEQRRRGLMYVQNLPPEQGMLFLFDGEEVQAFWMKNTLIYLDMIFIRADMTVAGVVEKAKPLTLDVRSVGVPSQYVLEVNGGWARAHAITDGAKVQFEHVF